MINKTLWIIVYILILFSGFKIRIGKNYLEWIGLLEQIYNCINKKYKNDNL
ncbi:MAG: hypothetical protein ACRCTZ_21850 [Sarcina sp.]